MKFLIDTVKIFFSMFFYLKKLYISNKNVIIYLLTSAVVGLLSVFTTTYLTNKLSTKEYGFVETFMSITALLTSLIMFGGSTFVSSYNNPDSKKNEYQYAFILILINTILIVFFSIAYIFYTNSDFYFFISLLILYSFFNSIFNIILTSFQLNRNVSSYSFYSILFSLLSTVFTVFAFIYFKNFYARLFSLVISLILLTSVALLGFKYFNYRSLSIKKNLKSAYLKGGYLALSQIFSWILEKSDRLIILALLNSSLLGIYGLGYQFGMLMLLIQSAVSKAWIPYLQLKLSQGERLNIKFRILKIALFYFIAVIGVSLMAWFYILKFININYHQSIIIVPLVSLGYAFDGIWKLYNSIFIIEEKYKLFSTQIIFVGIFNLLLTYIFVKYFGVYGAAISTASSFLVGLLWSYYYITFKLKWFS